MTRDPRTPDCSIYGCEYAAYRAGLCRKHHAMIPLDVKLRALGQMMERMSQASRAHASMMQVEVEQILSYQRP